MKRNSQGFGASVAWQRQNSDPANGIGPVYVILALYFECNWQKLFSTQIRSLSVTLTLSLSLTLLSPFPFSPCVLFVFSNSLERTIYIPAIQLDSFSVSISNCGNVPFLCVTAAKKEWLEHLGTQRMNRSNVQEEENRRTRP